MQVQQQICGKWETVLEVIGLKLAYAPGRSSRTTVARKITGMMSTRLNICTKSELRAMNMIFDRTVEGRASEADILAPMQQLKEDIQANTVHLDVDARGSLAEDELLQEAANTVRNAFREASLTAWAKKPLLSTAGMKEGT